MIKIQLPKDESNLPAQETKGIYDNAVASASYDFKTPLVSIIGSLETFERQKNKLTNSKKTTLINTALEEAYKLDKMMTNMLEMLKLECGLVPVKKELFMMDALLEECLVAMERDLYKCDVNIDAISQTFPLNSDPILLTRAISILLSKALRYAAPDPVIHIEYEKAQDKVTIRIQNNGNGIPPARLEELSSGRPQFSSQDHRQSNAGLEFLICQELMRLLGGSVTVANLDAGGAVFTLAFNA